MKEFLLILRRFIPPYKKYLVLTVLFNILSAVLNIFSFAALIPILQILFRTEGTGTATHLMPWTLDNIKEVMANNADYYVTQLIGNVGATTTLLLIGLFLAFTTFLKTGAYFLSSATIIPIRTGVVRDIRNQLYAKITSLPLGFFSEERKGDIIARMTGDVGEIESSIDDMMLLSTSCTSPLIRAMMSPLRSSEKKPNGSAVILRYSWLRMSRTTPVRMGMMVADDRK